MTMKISKVKIRVLAAWNNHGASGVEGIVQSSERKLAHRIFILTPVVILVLLIHFPVFAYVGGLVVFLSNFFKIVIHYTFRAIFLFIHWCHVTFGAREGHRTSMDLPEIASVDSHFNVSIQEPFQYVERNQEDETEITDDNLHCHLNSSIDTCINVEEGDSLVDAMIA